MHSDVTAVLSPLSGEQVVLQGTLNFNRDAKMYPLFSLFVRLAKPQEQSLANVKVGTVLFYQRIQGAEVERVEVIELFPPPPAELAFFMVRVVSSDRKGRIGVETQVTINSKQVHHIETLCTFVFHSMLGRMLLHSLGESSSRYAFWLSQITSRLRSE